MFCAWTAHVESNEYRVYKYYATGIQSKLSPHLWDRKELRWVTKRLGKSLKGRFKGGTGSEEEGLSSLFSLHPMRRKFAQS